jgi:hypothetical protein
MKEYLIEVYFFIPPSYPRTYCRYILSVVTIITATVIAITRIFDLEDALIIIIIIIMELTI